VRNTHRTPSDYIYDVNYRINGVGLPPLPPVLASSGVGIRMNLGPAFSLVADYGWQITRLAPGSVALRDATGNITSVVTSRSLLGLPGARNRAHVKVVLAY